jgi:large subunit ribosomal protein L18
MINQQLNSRVRRNKRALRVRAQLRGNSAKPRLSVFKSNKHISVQLIDDEAGVTLGSVSTQSKELKKSEFGKKNKASAKKLGELIADIAKQKNVKEVLFDRGPFKYHGILAEIADAARNKGLKL